MLKKSYHRFFLKVKCKNIRFFFIRFRTLRIFWDKKQILALLEGEKGGGSACYSLGQDWKDPNSHPEEILSIFIHYLVTR